MTSVSPFVPMASSPPPPTTFNAGAPAAPLASPRRVSDGASGEDDIEEMEPELVQLMEANDDDDVDVEDRNQDPYALLAQKDRDLILAAELGKALLEENKELQRRHEEALLEANARVEALEQEKYNMQQSFALRASEFESVIAELRSDNQEMQKQIRSQSEAHQTNDKQRQSAVGELAEQNQRLTQQLREAAAAEESLVAQVESLREQSKASKSSSHENQLQMESLKQEVHLLSDRKHELDKRLRNVSDERDATLASLEEANDRIMVLERQLNEQDQQTELQLEELQELRSTNSNLEEKIERMSIRISSPNPNGQNVSLFSELEMSSASDCGESSLFSQTQPKGLKTPCHSPFRRSPAHRPKPNPRNFTSLRVQLADEEYECDDEDDDAAATSTDDDDDSSLGGRRKSKSASAASAETARLRAKLTATEERLREALKAGEDEDGGVARKEEMLRAAWEERDEAIERQQQLEVQLTQAKTDLMNLDAQLIEAIQQKIELSQQLERWEIDLETLIEFQVKKKMETVVRDEEEEGMRIEGEREEKEKSKSLRSRVARKLFKSAQ